MNIFKCRLKNFARVKITLDLSFLFSCSTMQWTETLKILRMLGFEPRISSFGSER